MSRWAKNASTTTMRIGKAALLKNLLTCDLLCREKGSNHRPCNQRAYQG
jgi:hypothetical protein